MCIYNAIQSSYNICSEQIERLPHAVTLRYIICHTQTHTHFLRHFISALIISSNGFRLYMRCSRAFRRLIFFIRSIPEMYTIFSGITLDINIVVLFIYIYIYSRSALATFEVFTPSVHGRHNIIYIYIHLCLRSYVYSCVIMHHSFAIYSIRIIYIIYSRVSCIDFFFYLFIIKVRKPQHCIA